MKLLQNVGIPTGRERGVRMMVLWLEMVKMVIGQCNDTSMASIARSRCGREMASLRRSSNSKLRLTHSIHLFTAIVILIVMGGYLYGSGFINPSSDGGWKSFTKASPSRGFNWIVIIEKNKAFQQKWTKCQMFLLTCIR